MTRPQHLYEVVKDMSPPATREIVRAAMKAFTADEHAEWNRLKDCERKQVKRDAKKGPAVLDDPTADVRSSQITHTGNVPVVLEVEDRNISGCDEKLEPENLTAKEAGFSLDSFPEENPGKKEKPLRGKKKESTPCQTEAEWLADLGDDETYRRVNVQLEAGKCRRWAETNNKVFSKRRFVNWLNNALDRVPMNENIVQLPTAARVLDQAEKEAFQRRMQGGYL